MPVSFSPFPVIERSKSNVAIHSFRDKKLCDSLCPLRLRGSKNLHSDSHVLACPKILAAKTPTYSPNFSREDTKLRSFFIILENLKNLLFSTDGLPRRFAPRNNKKGRKSTEINFVPFVTIYNFCNLAGFGLKGAYGSLFS